VDYLTDCNSPNRSFHNPAHKFSARERSVSDNSTDIFISSPKEDFTCKICFDGLKDPSDSLISPCLCQGSVKYIHEECLKTWLAGKEQNLDESTCEICKSKYKMEFGLEKEFSCGNCLQHSFSHFTYPAALILFFAGLVLLVVSIKQKVVQGNSTTNDIFDGVIAIIVVLAVFVVGYLIINSVKQTCFVEVVKNWRILNFQHQNKPEETVNHTDANLLDNSKLPFFEELVVQDIDDGKNIKHKETDKTNIHPQLARLQGLSNLKDTGLTLNKKAQGELRLNNLKDEQTLHLEESPTNSQLIKNDKLQILNAARSKVTNKFGFCISVIPEADPKNVTFTNLSKVPTFLGSNKNLDVQPLYLKSITEFEEIRRSQNPDLVEELRKGFQELKESVKAVKLNNKLLKFSFSRNNNPTELPV